MISTLQLEGFKRFRSNTFALRPLTVLAGMNGTGKTSLIHALLLAREATRQKQGIVSLNGPFGLELGTFEDVANYESGDHFEISLTDEAERTESFTFSGALSDRFATAIRQGPDDRTVLS